MNNFSILKAFLFSCFVLTITSASAYKPYGSETANAMKLIRDAYHVDSLAFSIYSDLNKTDLDYEVFLNAVKGYSSFKKQGLIENSKVLTIIDFDRSSDKKRFFIIDMEKHEIVAHSYVAHGQKTGELEAYIFSNRENSHQSSLGFYLTDQTYIGKHGLSLRLDGLEKGINDNARKRNIVVHSADYVSEEYINKNKRLGRSWGCPALPEEGYQEVIDQIKDKSLLFVYSSKLKLSSSKTF